MDNHSTPNQPTNTPYREGNYLPRENQAGFSAESLLLNRLTTEIDGLKQTLHAQTQQSTIEMSQLRKQLRWLASLSAVAIIVLGGALVGITMNLRQEQIAMRESQQELIAQLDGLQADQITSEQLAQLETLLSNLNQTTGNIQEQAQAIIDQIPGASREQLESLQNDLKDLQQNVQEQLSQENGGIVDRMNGVFQRVQDFLKNEGNNDNPSSESET